jgi:hypothetical protein
MNEAEMVQHRLQQIRLNGCRDVGPSQISLRLQALKGQISDAFARPDHFCPIVGPASKRNFRCAGVGRACGQDS